MQLLGDLDILSFVRKRRLNWTARVNRTDNARKVSKVFNNNLRRSRLRRRPKTDGWILYEQILINAELHIGKRGQETAD